MNVNSYLSQDQFVQYSVSIGAKITKKSVCRLQEDTV